MLETSGFESLHSGQFSLSTQFNGNTLHRRSTTVSLETYPFKAMLSPNITCHQVRVFFSFPGLFRHKIKSNIGVLLFLQTNVIRYKSTEFMTFSMCVATFVVSLLWTIYGQLVQDNFILVSGAF